ncbi:hypothetical protein [Noviherbaspirillum sedimenti]|uniref:hypothetical protein n=1 Tax=Noviherbaspirillum sedimenti TaxID=2320865 RepID=UPI0011C3DE06|nr:hypothetical protein [Noviherbaspirillum sedimenti]
MDYLDKIVQTVQMRRLRILLGRAQFVISFYESDEGRACLICQSLADFSEEEIWRAHESESLASDLVRRAIEFSSTVACDFFIFSYPERHSKIGNNAMVLLAAERDMTLARFFSCHPDASGEESREDLRSAARWNGRTSLPSLRAAGVSLLLVACRLSPMRLPTRCWPPSLRLPNSFSRCSSCAPLKPVSMNGSRLSQIK